MDTDLHFRAYTYDVWGNHKNGFEVNQVYKSFETVWIPRALLSDDKALLTYLKRKGLINGRRDRWDPIQDGGLAEDGSLVLYFSYRGRPVFELRMEDENAKPEGVARMRDFVKP